MAEEKVVNLRLEEPPIHPQAQQYYCELVVAISELADKRREIRSLQGKLHDMKQELCELCGNYRYAYDGACDDCRWRDV